MIIRSVRLKNIKSYGTGETDEGITIEFESGVNRIAGRNGHGKSTVIEAIGYALFLAKPDYAENFKVETYLLRDGANEGEIDVTFEHLGAVHRIERGVGRSSKRRAKVISLDDESFCAEGDKEVEEFLCKLLGVPSAKNLIEIFTKLVGVKQGRLTRPFDSKGAEARNFFQPLFDVAIFKECFDKLKPAKYLFDERLNKVRIRKAGIDQKIAERADGKEKFAQAKETIKQQEFESHTAIKARYAAKAEKEKHEQLKQMRAEAEKVRDDAKHELQLKENQLNSAKVRLAESEKAGATAKETLPAHETYLDAVKQLKVLEKQRVERDGLKDRWNKAENQLKERKAGADNARDQSKSLSEQQKEKSWELEKKDRERAAVEKKLSDSQLDFEKAEEAFAEANDFHSELHVWISGLPGATKRISEGTNDIVRLHKEMSSWKPEALKAAEEAHGKTTVSLKTASTRLAEARERKTTLKAQLDQISGGVCPFLKEACNQFDLAKVKSDLSNMELEIAKGEKIFADWEEATEKTAEALNVLKEEQAQLKPKQESLDSDSEDLLEEFKSLLPKRISDAAGKLRAWDETIDSMPGSPSVQKEIKPENVVELSNKVSLFTDKAENWWQRLEQIVEEKKETHKAVKKERACDEQNLAQLRERKNELTTEGKNLTEEAEAKLNKAKRLDEASDESQKQVEELDGRLKAYASLDDDLTTQRERLEANRDGHEKNLQAKELAGALETRKKTTVDAESKCKEVHEKLKVEEQKFVDTDKAFDSEAFGKVIADYEAKSNAVATLEEKLNYAKETKIREEKRFQEWEAACKELIDIEDDILRLEASIEITELARKVLQNAAPMVAQHLCDRIAVRAQTVFNQINPDPIELSWEAKQYSVRIVPGDRRFAMLSGGEQTKLSLALTLAMIEEFGGLRFCIFDEPTYGVDADSRPKLADAIVEAQSAANLEQLLLISHDDAFEGKIEHAILLNKSAGSGSTVSKEQ